MSPVTVAEPLDLLSKLFYVYLHCTETKTNMKSNFTPREHPLFLKAFRAYIQYVNSGLYFRKEHVVGLENVPVNGTPVVLVANH